MACERNTRPCLHPKLSFWFFRCSHCRRFHPLPWRHNWRDGDAKHQRLDGLLNRCCLGAYQREKRWPLDSLNKRPVTRKIFPFDDVIKLRRHFRFVASLLIYLRYPLQWRYNDHDGVSNHQPRGCLLNRLFRRRSKKTSKLRVTGLCVGNSPGPVNSPHKRPVTRKMFPFDDVIMHC